jgi:hypothetical protein
MNETTNLELCFRIELNSYRDKFFEARQEYEYRLAQFISRNLFTPEEFSLQEDRASNDLIDHFYRYPLLDGVDVYLQMIRNAVEEGIDHISIH